MLKKFFAAILVFLFVGVSLPFWAIVSFDNTFLSGNFYKNKIDERTYDLLAGVLAEQLHSETDFLSKNFREDEIKKDILSAFSYREFDLFLDDFAGEVDKLKDKNVNKFVLPMQNLKASLAKFSKKVAGEYLNSLPECDKDTALEDFDVRSDVKCLPKGLEIDSLYQVLEKEVEMSIQRSVPDTVEWDFTSEGPSKFKEFIVKLNDAKVVLMVVMVVMLLLMFVLNGFDLVESFLFWGVAFLWSGVVNISMLAARQKIFEGIQAQDGFSKDLAVMMIGYPFEELKVWGMVLVAVGLVLIALRLFSGKTVKEV